LANGYGIGLANLWCVVWTWAMMFKREGEWRRVERVRVRVRVAVKPKMKEDRKEDKKGQINGFITTGRKEVDDVLRRRMGPVKPVENDRDQASDSDSNTPSYVYRYVWQPLPKAYLHRLEWTFDLLTNFRGPGWNWRIAGMEPLAASIQQDLDTPLSLPVDTMTKDIPPPAPPHTDALPAATKTLLAHTLLSFLHRYLALDALKVIMMRDPYFLGLISITTNAPPDFLPTYPSPALPYPTILTTSPVLLKITRLTLSLLGVYYALTFIFTLGPLFFIFVLRPLHPYLHTPYAEPFLYPPLFGPLTSILDHGLTGVWSKWWHQMFRFGFTAPSTFVARKLGWDPKSPRAKALQLFTAFSLSGCLHGCSSYTQFAPTRPLSGPFLFFVLQALGISGQIYVAGVIAPKMRLPSFLRGVVARRATNLIFVLVWSYVTGPLLADDFARGGIWLFEPVPVSALRALGLGLREEGWWCWGRGRWGGWYEDRRGRWWRSGIYV
jgi:hypothetical protein